MATWKQIITALFIASVVVIAFTAGIHLIKKAADNHTDRTDQSLNYGG